jgi:hypothetical protein
MNAKEVEFPSPTWSWSALGGQAIAYPDSGNTPQQLCEVIKVECIPLSNSNPRGQVRSAKLVIRGHVIKAVLKDGKVYLPGNNLMCTLDYDVSLPGPNHVEEGSTLFCLTVCAILPEIYAIILRCTDVGAQIYQRIGLIRCLGSRERLLVNIFPEGLFARDRENYEAGAKEMHSISVGFDSPKHALDTLLDSIKPHSMPQFRSDHSGTLLIKLTPEQAANAKSHPLAQTICKRTTIPLNEPKEGKWFLSPQEAEKKARGEDFKKFYLGKIVTIV